MSRLTICACCTRWGVDRTSQPNHSPVHLVRSLVQTVLIHWIWTARSLLPPPHPHYPCMLLKLLELRFWWPYSLFTTEGYCDFTSEAPTLVRTSATQHVDAFSSHDPSLPSHPQDPSPHLPNCPSTNRIEPVISADNTVCLVPSASHAVTQAPTVLGARLTTAPCDPRDQSIPSHAPQGPSQARARPVYLIDSAHAKQVFFHGAQHFEVGNFVHAPNAAQVHIANESNQHNTVRIGMFVQMSGVTIEVTYTTTWQNSDGWGKLRIMRLRYLQGTSSMRPMLPRSTWSTKVRHQII